MTPTEMQAALDGVFDQAIVFHGFTDYMRDYEVITYSAAAPATGIEPVFDRFLFRNSVDVHVATEVSPEVWDRSLADFLTTREAMHEPQDGYVWGVRWQCIYPGASAIPEHPLAAKWTANLGIDCHATRWSTNCHQIEIIHTDLTVSRVDEGYAPFVASHD